MNPSIDQHILIDRLEKDDAIRAREIRRDPQAPWWVFGGSFPRGVPTDFYARIIGHSGGEAYARSSTQTMMR
jgi:hypothetical protein